MPQKHLYLPKVISGANISEPVSNAVWEDKERQIVTAISDAIEVDEAIANKGVSSIPDIYARPLTFLGALRYDQHPLRSRMVQEWRGLLSLLALHAVKPDLGKLVVSSVPLNDEKFCRALKNLAPHAVPLQKNGTDYQWTDFLIIKFEDIPIGAFSPATLLYTSADYNTKLKKLNAFSLIDEQGYLRPPGKDDGLDYVGKWLETFIQRFNNVAQSGEHSNKGHLYTGVINKLLSQWLKEIKQELGVSSNEPIPANKVKVAEEMPEYIRLNPPMFLAKYEIYQQILTPLVKEFKEGDVHKSDYSLRMARNRSAQSGSEYKEVVIISQQLLAQNRKIWDDTTPRELSEDTYTLIDKFFPGACGTVINRIDLKNDNSIWIRPELYFLTDQLLKSKTDHDILNSAEKFLNAGDAEFILPFKKEILQFFSPIDIQEILKPHFNKVEGRVIFSFQLPLVDGKVIEIKKTYRERSAGLQDGDGEIVETEVPVLEMFPNYLGDFWCQYFMLCSNIDSFCITPLNYDHLITITRKEQLIETNNSREKAELLRITGYDSFPEAIGIASNQGEKKNYGLILLNKDTNVSRPFNGKVIVGIDLGTSNTNIYRYTDGNARRWQYRFSKYVRSILNSDPSAINNIGTKSGVSKRDKITRAFFVPTQDQELPIPTLLRIFKAGITTDVLLDQFIYFPNEPQYPNNIDTDIKWSDDITKMQAFIQSTVFLLLIDLLQDRVGNIQFRCTFPKSYSDDRVHGLKLGWTQILQRFIYVEGKTETDSIGSRFIWTRERDFEDDNGNFTFKTTRNGKLTINTVPAFTTEGIAAGEYFSSDLIIQDGVSNANKQDGAICIDVGGGTTDYSIWFESEIKMDASVLLAGRQISKLLKNNSRVRDLLLSESAADSLNEVRDDEQSFFSRLNYILRQEEKQISSNLGTHSQSKDIAWLRRILAIEFGALAFYAAHLTLALDEYLKSKLSNSLKENSFKLHWGGNAAKFINWIDYGRYEPDGIASRFINGIFGNTIYDKANIGERAFKPRRLSQVQSPAHKDEASGGVSVMNKIHSEKKSGSDIYEQDDFYLVDDEVNDDSTMDGLVLGEQVSINDIQYEHYQRIVKNGFFNDGQSVFNNTTLKQLERFIYLVNQVGRGTGLFPEGSEINLSVDEKLAIKQRVKNKLAEQAKEKNDERSIEPIFILEVKFMLDILSHKMR